MRLREAHRQATARWGGRGIAHIETLVDDEGEHVVCSVGRHGHDAHSWDALGVGVTFEDAFAAADALEHPRLHPAWGGVQ
jgi:hypothetical protein